MINLKEYIRYGSGVEKGKQILDNKIQECIKCLSYLHGGAEALSDGIEQIKNDKEIWRAVEVVTLFQNRIAEKKKLLCELVQERKLFEQ